MFQIGPDIFFRLHFPCRIKQTSLHHLCTFSFCTKKDRVGIPSSASSEGEKNELHRWMPFEEVYFRSERGRRTIERIACWLTGGLGVSFFLYSRLPFSLFLLLVISICNTFYAGHRYCHFFQERGEVWILGHCHC